MIPQGKRLPPGISRHPDGYLVRIYRGKRTISRFVSKSNVYPFAQAFHVLSKMRDEYPEVPRDSVRSGPQRNSMTGVLGVSLAPGLSGRTGKEMPAYSVHYKKNGKPSNKRFYFSAYGGDSQAAFLGAVEFRRVYESDSKRQHAQSITPYKSQVKL